MRIGIIGGTGSEGRGIAVRWARAGHDVFVGSRDAARAAAAAGELSATAGRALQGGDNAACVAHGEVVLLAVPYGAHGDTLRALAPGLKGRVLIDITVPLKPPQVRTVHLPPGNAAAIEAQAIVGAETRVVATLHHVSAAHLADPDHEIDCDVLLCGDDGPAKEMVAGLLRDLALTPIDVGPLANAVALEALTPVLLHINRAHKIAGSGIRVTGIPRAPRG
jgi:8-hydroxy-5-deazaflavin:NADPH oxidoreductase